MRYKISSPLATSSGRSSASTFPSKFDHSHLLMQNSTNSNSSSSTMALGIPSSTESTLILPTQPGWWSFSFDVLVSEILQVRNFNRSIYVFQTDQAGERIPRFVLKTERNEMGDLQTFLSRCGDSGTPNEFFALICWNSISHLIWLTRGDRAYTPDEIFPSQGSA